MEGHVMKVKPYLLAIFLPATACATLQLTPQGRAVQLLSTAPADLASTYTELGTVTCSRGSNARKAETNIVQCQNELRNTTAEMGGDLVVVTSQQLGTGDCANCITLVGTAYRRTRS
jgi:hypothetical protein